jgi:acetyl-CoA carboxylase biotin carboxyl carrier protein
MPPSKPTSSGIDPEIVRELAAILRETDLSEIEVEVQRGELKLRIARHIGGPVSMAPPQMIHHAAPAPHATPAASALAPAAALNDDRANPGMVPSPMVGTAYLSPEPGADVFVSVGDTVTEGQTVMIVEAMKTMNPIPAPRGGKVTKICVADSQPVEYGEPLLIIE